jgi:Protein of unknown function (DUF2778)
MRVRTAWADHSPAYDDDSDPIVPAGFSQQALSLPNALPQQLLGAAALTCVALTCAWGICTNLGGGGSADTSDAMRSDRLVFAADRGDRLEDDGAPGLANGNIASANINVSAFDDRFSAAFPPGVFLGSDGAQSVAYDPALPTPSGGDRHVAALTPAPAPLSLSPRLRRHAKLALPEPEQQPETVASAPPEQPSLFERIFGRSTSSIFAKLYGPPPSKVSLAYAEDGTAGDGNNVTAGLYDRQTAVYDISAHTVYLPDGTTLEAHSGYGARLDDPSSATVRDLGVTPPDIYDLKPREAIFHGVHALRLIPEDESKVFGRAGLLAHTYMLGPNGQSNGCVSFKDYDAFLQAYETHEITRIAVVSHID